MKGRKGKKEMTDAAMRPESSIIVSEWGKNRRYDGCVQRSLSMMWDGMIYFPLVTHSSTNRLQGKNQMKIDEAEHKDALLLHCAANVCLY